MLAWETGNEMARAHHSLPALPSAQRLTPEGMISQLRLSGGNFRVLLKFAGMFPVRPVQCVVLFSLWGILIPYGHTFQGGTLQTSVC